MPQPSTGKMDEHHLILLILAALIVGSIALAYGTLVDVSTDARGIVRTNGTMRVTAEVAGKVINVYLRQGQPVHAGDPLVQLDTHQVDHDLQVLQTRIHVLETRLMNSRDETARVRLRNFYRLLHLTELARSQLTVTSPADGLLDVMHGFLIGQAISGGEEIATIIPSDRDLTVEARITEPLLELVHVGQPVSMQPDDRTDEGTTVFMGTVQNITQQMKSGGSALEYIVAIAPNNDSSLGHEKALRVKFLQPRRRLLRVMIDRVNGALGRLWRLNKENQPGSAFNGTEPTSEFF
jgi:multidrug resistance efflux pump